MSELGLVAPPQQIKVTFSAAPAYNALDSLLLLTSEFSIPSQWVRDTAAALTPEQLKANERHTKYAIMGLDGQDWPSLLAYLDHLEGCDPAAIRDRSLQHLVESASKQFGDVPTLEELLADREAYITLLRRLYALQDEPCKDCDLEADFEALQDPAARHREAIVHLRNMWDRYLAEEWQRSLPMIDESIAAFKTIDYSNKSPDDIFKLVVDREFPPVWAHARETLKQIIFVPSPHIAPFLGIMVGPCQGAHRVVFGARVPEGTVARSPALSRSELLTRLTTLADDTRLRILELLSEQGEQNATEIADKLGLSQSSASRHLRQLCATNYVAERRFQGAKHYNLNQDRIDVTFYALKNMLHKR